VGGLLALEEAGALWVACLPWRNLACAPAGPAKNPADFGQGTPPLLALEECGLCACLPWRRPLVCWVGMLVTQSACLPWRKVVCAFLLAREEKCTKYPPARARESHLGWVTQNDSKNSHRTPIRLAD
jgi:hypothetical protein